MKFIEDQFAKTEDRLKCILYVIPHEGLSRILTIIKNTFKNLGTFSLHVSESDIKTEYEIE